MPKFAIEYSMRGIGYFFVEANTLNLAYSEFYKQKFKDNSLIVHARFHNRFEIRGHEELISFPRIPRYRVTTAEQIERANAGEIIEEEAPRPLKFANTELFEFLDEMNTQRK
jgi:hypothetical protein